MNKNRYYGSHILYRVLIKHEHLKSAMAAVLPPDINAHDKAWIQHMCYMSLRHGFSLRARWQKFLYKPLKDQLVAQLLTFSMAQKVHADVPDHAIVNEAVNTAKLLKKTNTFRLPGLSARLRTITARWGSARRGALHEQARLNLGLRGLARACAAEKKACSVDFACAR